MLDYANFNNPPYNKYGWVRPTDRPPVPNIAVNSVVLLVEVTDDDSNYVYVRATATGGYTVDWGDGTTDTWSTNTLASHKYTYSSISSAVTLGFIKYVWVKITPTVSGNDLTGFTAGGIGTNFRTNYGYRHNYLEAYVNAPNMTSLTFGETSGATSPLLEYVSIIQCGAVTTRAMFRGCNSLKRVDFCDNFMSSSDSSAALAQMFSQCYSLQYIKLPYNFGKYATRIDNMFAYLNMLRWIDWAADADISITNASGIGQIFMETNIQILDMTKLPIGAFPATTMSQTISYCRSLIILKFKSNQLSNITSTSLPFYNSYSRRIIGCGMPVSFDVASGALGPQALNEIYTALPTVTGKTITVTNAYGVTADDPTIATAKGWTVSGT